MSEKISPQEIAEYRKTARKKGLEVTHLSDHEVARQIQILRGGLYKPSLAELDKIRARAKKTEKVFLSAERTVLRILKKADLALKKLDGGKPARKRGAKERVPDSRKMAKILLELPNELLGTPPSLLSAELQRRLAEINRLAARAKQTLEQGGDPAESDVGEMARKVREAIKKS